MTGIANTILIEPADGRRTIRERPAEAADILPGMLLFLGEGGGWQPHPLAGQNTQRVFALENLADAKGIDDVYALADTVRGLYAQSGDLVNAVLGANVPLVVIGDFMESDGGGFLRKVEIDAATSDVERVSIVGVASEAVDNSGGPEGARIQVEVV